MPRTSAGKPDANKGGSNFLLEMLNGLKNAQQKFHAEWRGEGTIRPPINEKAQGLVPSAPWASLSSAPDLKGDPKPWKQATSM